MRSPAPQWLWHHCVMNARIVEQTQKMLNPDQANGQQTNKMRETCTSFRTNALEMIRFCGLILSAAIYFYAHSGNVCVYVYWTFRWRVLVCSVATSDRSKLSSGQSFERTQRKLRCSWPADTPRQLANRVCCKCSLYDSRWTVSLTWLTLYDIFPISVAAPLLVHRIGSVYCACLCWFN